MFTVCEVLQRARLDQGIDLATVAARTKIKAKYLQAIEADDRENLPAGFFYKSFVHQYAKFLGVDTSAIDAEIDDALRADAARPLPSVARQTVLKRSSRSWSTKRSLFLCRFGPHTRGLLWNRWLVARPRGRHAENREPSGGCGKHHTSESAKARYRASSTRCPFPRLPPDLPWLRRLQLP